MPWRSWERVEGRATKNGLSIVVAWVTNSRPPCVDQCLPLDRLEYDDDDMEGILQPGHR